MADNYEEALRAALKSGNRELAAALVRAKGREQQPQQRGFFEALDAGDVHAATEALPFAAGIGRGIEEMRANLARNIAPVRGAIRAAAPGLAGAAQAFEAIPSPPSAPEYQAQQYQQFRERHPYTAEAGRIGARLAPSAVMPTTLPGNLAAVAGASMLEEEPLNAAAWGAPLAIGGHQLGNVLGRFHHAKTGQFPTRAIDPALDPTGSRAALQQAGGRLTPFEATGKAGPTMEAVAAHPWTRRIMDTVRGTQDDAMQKALAESMGTKITRFDDEAILDIADEIGGRFKAFADSVDNVPLPRGFAGDAKQILTETQWGKWGDEISSGSIGGPTLKLLRTELGEAAFRGSGDRADRALVALRDLDDALAEAVPPSKVAEYARVREQFVNYLGVRDLRAAGSRSAQGEIGARTLLGRMRQKYSGRRPRNPESRRMMEIVRGRADLAPYQRSPGTAEQIGNLDIYHTLVRAPRAMVGAGMLGAPSPQAQAVGALLGRLTATPTLREQTPFYP